MLLQARKHDETQRFVMLVIRRKMLKGRFFHSLRKVVNNELMLCIFLLRNVSLLSTSSFEIALPPAWLCSSMD